jgi:hypothetical protein
MFGFMGLTVGEIGIVEAQLRQRFKEVAPALPPEIAKKIFEDLNMVAAFRKLSESAKPPWSDPGSLEQYDRMTRKAESTWRDTLSRTWQEAVAEGVPWYKKKENLLILGGAALVLILLVSFTGKKES